MIIVQLVTVLKLMQFSACKEWILCYGELSLKTKMNNIQSFNRIKEKIQSYHFNKEKHFTKCNIHSCFCFVLN